MSMSLYVQRVVGFLYAGSHQLLHNLTDMHQKPSACFSLHMDMVPMAYQRYDIQSSDLCRRRGWHRQEINKKEHQTCGN
jgi:hypothetical protein